MLSLLLPVFIDENQSIHCFNSIVLQGKKKIFSYWSTDTQKTHLDIILVPWGPYYGKYIPVNLAK